MDGSELRAVSYTFLAACSNTTDLISSSVSRDQSFVVEELKLEYVAETLMIFLSRK